MRKLNSMSPPTTVMAVLMREDGWLGTETPPLKPPSGVFRPALNPAAALAS